MNKSQYVRIKKVSNALGFAIEAHRGQKRKWTGEDFIVHPIRVAEIVRLHGESDEVVMAAYLHDVVEDTPYTKDDIKERFGDLVAYLVDGVTHVAPKEAYPDLNRAQRKKIERDFLSGQSSMVKIIKIADIIDNINDMELAPEGFARVTIEECRLALEEALTGASAVLTKRAYEDIQKLEDSLST